MIRQQRHGLSTILLTGEPDPPGLLLEHLLGGRKTVVLRPATPTDPEPLERAGDRVLLVDSAGRSLAVADVVSTLVTFLRHVSADVRSADDPDHPEAAQWAECQLARWRQAGLLPAPVAGAAGGDLLVVVIAFRVVGLEARPGVARRTGAS